MSQDYTPSLFAAGPTALEAVERAAGDLRRGLPVVVEAGGRGLTVLAAELATPERLARLAGSLAVYLTHARAETLKIRLYTPETVAVPLAKDDPAGFARHLADPTADLRHPLAGPYRARRGPLPAAAAAALRLLKLAGLLPAAVAPLEAEAGAAAAARAAGFLSVSAAAIAEYPQRAADELTYVVAAHVPLAGAEASRIMAFRPGGGGPESLAIIVGEPDLSKPVLVRLHSECFTGDLLGSLKCDCGEQLKGAIRRMAEEGSGVLLYLAQEGRGIGLMNKLRAYALQDQGFDTMEANERLGFAADERDFSLAAAMLHALGIRQVRLLTNNPEKVTALERLGVKVAERVAHAFPPNVHNRRYLETKAKKGGHAL
jgi:GTP cyclohydrolase II